MTNSSFKILIVDDEPNIRSGLAKGLTSEADTIDTAGDAGLLGRVEEQGQKIRVRF